MRIYTGYKLKKHVDTTLKSNYKKRYIFEQLHAYISGEDSSRIACLFGLRRTGKTVLMLQEIEYIGSYQDTMLLRCEDGDDMWEVREAVDKELERNPNLKYLFVDEATKANRFVNTCSFFADDYAAGGLKVVLAGTDSLGFALAESRELYDRIDMLHTTYISFPEFNYLLGKGISDYIAYGGTLTDGVKNVFYNKDNAAKYTNSAIIENIFHSLKNWNNGYNCGMDVLGDIVDKNDFPSFVNKVLEYHNRTFLAKVINERFSSHDIGSLSDLMTRHGIANPAPLQENEVAEKVRIFLNIRENHFTYATDEAVNAIVSYLKLADVLYEIPQNANVGTSKDTEYLFTQPGLRYCQATALADALIASSQFDNYSEQQKLAILEKLDGDIRGQILEDVVFYHLLRATEGTPYKVSKYRSFDNKEIDVLVTDTESAKTVAIEVKLSSVSADRQRAHLKDAKLCGEIESKLGSQICERIVLYMGEDTEIEGVKYRNVEQFLLKFCDLLKDYENNSKDRI